MSASVLRIATRKSALALWQAEHVAGLLRRAHAGLEVELVPLSTRGDEILDRSLATVGGKGLFLKELEVAMLEGRADIAVHSLKDVPVDLDAEFVLAAMLARDDPSDALVSNDSASMAALPEAARVGTSSLRRKAQLMAVRPDLRALDLRGNVHTRLHKLDRGDYDAIVLASAGLERLGLGARIGERLHAPAWLSAPGQAALCVECRANDVRVQEMLKMLDDASTRIACTAERSMNRKLGGSCVVPVGALARFDGQKLRLQGMVGDPGSGKIMRAHDSADADQAESLGRTVAEALLAQGAAEFLHTTKL